MDIHIKGKFAATVGRILYWYFDLIERILRSNFRIEASPKGLSLSVDDGRTSKGSLDERITRIDEARENLIEGLNAIDELKASAQENKKELEAALLKLKVLEEDKNNAELELEQVRHIAQADIKTFQKMAGIPSGDEIKRKQVIAFLSGVLASLVASGIAAAIGFLL